MTDALTLRRFAFYTFAGLLTIPWLFCVYQLVTHNIGRTRRIKYVLDEHTAPKTVIVMPCYNELPHILLRTVDSLVDCEYPPSCLHIFLSFDGDQEDDLYLNTIDKLGVPLTLKGSYPRSIDVVYRRCRITVSRFPHGGKRSCQKNTFKLIDRVYQDYLRRHDDLFVLFIDSDCILDKYCIQSFLYEMELKPGSKRKMLAQTGVITSTTAKNSLITLLQDIEYIHGQLFERTVESACGAVTCLPGALTIFRFSALRKVAKFYFADKESQCEDLFDYSKMHLGEDRFLTHLLMISSTESYQIQMNTGAFCKTEACQTVKSLIKQRRRWFLGFITNESIMLTDIRLWRRYPLLMIIRLAQNTIRTTALLFFIMVISILTTSQKIANLPVGFIAVSLGLNWVLMLYFGAKLGRYKIMLYPLMFVVNPFFNWLYQVYAVLTAGRRTWGGPRADAGRADDKTTPEQVAVEAQAAGDDLNVVPETFKPAAETLKRKPIEASLLPPARLQGRFAPAEQLPGGWYRQANDSGVLPPGRTPRHFERRHRSRGSPASSASPSPVRPRRVESIVGVEDALIYHQRQAHQRPAGGAFFEAARPPFAPPAAVDSHLRRRASAGSLGSEASVPLHFDLPPPRPLQPDLPATGAHPPPPPSHPPQARTRQDPSPPEHVHRSPPVTHQPLQESRRTRLRSAPATRPALPTAHQPLPGSTTGSSTRRTGRSPLARKSFTRLAADQETVVDLDVDADRSRRVSSDEEELRGRGRRRWTRRPSMSVDRHGWRRLSKASRGSSREDAVG